MARSISQTLTKLTLLSPKSPPRISTVRSLKTDIDYDTDNTVSPPTTTDPDILAFRKIEDAIHRIIVRRSTPDWLPFYPGASYWVPPKSESRGIAELFGKFTHKLSEDEALSLTVERGWPSSAYYCKGTAPRSVKIEILSNMPESEDDEA